jgi:hypothetical protein
MHITENESIRYSEITGIINILFAHHLPLLLFSRCYYYFNYILAYIRPTRPTYLSSPPAITSYVTYSRPLIKAATTIDSCAVIEKALKNTKYHLFDEESS